jgi:zinc/manganese transport system ATP-binding protein
MDSGRRARAPRRSWRRGDQRAAVGSQILHDVSFRIEAGEFTGLIGSNGAGKTTLLRVILGLQAPTVRSVLVDGRPRSPRNPLIGYVPQKIVLDPDMPLRARDLVGLGSTGTASGCHAGRRDPEGTGRRDARRRRRHRFRRRPGGNLSGGEQQRVLIAHALISRPRLLLLDEPLANLDIRSEQEVVELVARIATEQQIAVLISAHDMNPLLPVMDRVVYVAAAGWPAAPPRKWSPPRR